jgi:putative intracellular protease/amidase
MTNTSKRRALIIIPSARQLPLAEPASVGSISTGFFLVELAQVLKESEHDHEFTFATPDGNPPQLDINGMGLAFHAIEKLGQQTATTMLEQRRASFDADRYRRRHAALVQRREQELRLLERHLGRLPVSEILPNTDREAAAFRPELVRRLEALQPQRFYSVEALVRRHRDPHDQFSFADFDFLHAPGGHAPMVDFRDNPWLGEALHLAREHGVLISLICHAPIAMTSTWQRVDRQGSAYQVAENPFLEATIATVPKHGERAAESAGYVHLPGQRTRLTYYVDEALKEAGFTLRTGLNPAAVKLLYEPAVGLLTGNGPQTIDAQARTLRSIVSTRPALRDARLRT